MYFLAFNVYALCCMRFWILNLYSLIFPFLILFSKKKKREQIGCMIFPGKMWTKAYSPRDRKEILKRNDCIHVHLEETMSLLGSCREACVMMSYLPEFGWTKDNCATEKHGLGPVAAGLSPLHNYLPFADFSREACWWVSWDSIVTGASHFPPWRTTSIWRR